MKKKPKSSPKKPKKAAAKKPAPKKPAAKKPAPKKPVKKVAPKKAKAKIVPKKKEVKKQAVKAKPKPQKPAAKKAVVKAKPISKKPDPKIKIVSKKAELKAAAKAAPKVADPKGPPPPKAKRPPPAPKKRFVVLPPRPLVPSEVKDDIKNLKGLYKLEYIVSSSPDVLFEFLSTAGGLEKWFAPRVFIKDNTFVFSWGNDEMKQATLLALREREFVRFRWQEQPEKRYFEFRLQIDDLTNEIALIVSDFADTKEDLESARLLWNAQIHDLLHALGSS